MKKKAALMAFILGVSLLLGSCGEAETEAQEEDTELAYREQQEREEEIYENGLRDGWNKLLDVIKESYPQSDFYLDYIHPEDLAEEVQEGEWTMEDLVSLYSDLWYEMYETTNVDPDEWAEYCEDTLDYSWYN